MSLAKHSLYEYYENIYHVFFFQIHRQSNSIKIFIRSNEDIFHMVIFTYFTRIVI